LWCQAVHALPSDAQQLLRGLWAYAGIGSIVERISWHCHFLLRKRLRQSCDNCGLKHHFASITVQCKFPISMPSQSKVGQRHVLYRLLSTLYVVISCRLTMQSSFVLVVSVGTYLWRLSNFMSYVLFFCYLVLIYVNVHRVVFLYWGKRKSECLFRQSSGICTIVSECHFPHAVHHYEGHCVWWPWF